MAILHCLPIEGYPPVQNFLHHEGTARRFKVILLTTSSLHSRSGFDVDGVLVVRFPSLNRFLSRWLRLVLYYLFNVGSLLRLVIFRPKVLLYYDSYSALPAYWYLRYFNANVRLFIHFHEYFSKKWYQSGMKTVRFYHDRERSFLFERASIISQTNADRVRFFLNDHPTIPETKMKVIPNYPPLKWLSVNARNVSEAPPPLRTVYIGSVSLHSTWVKEYVNWVITQNGKVIFDAYSTVYDKSTKSFFDQLCSPWVRFFHEGIRYDDIPQRISSEGYHVGIIFYKGLHDNTVYCASNKLFEYLACGLDVWISTDMLGSRPYATTNSFPKVLLLDFSHPERFDIQTLINRDGSTYCPSRFYCEDIFEDWLSLLHNSLQQ